MKFIITSAFVNSGLLGRGKNKLQQTQSYKAQVKDLEPKPKHFTCMLRA